MISSSLCSSTSKKNGVSGKLGAQPVHVQPPAEAAHRVLERLRPLIGRECDDFAVENELARARAREPRRRPREVARSRRSGCGCRSRRDRRLRCTWMRAPSSFHSIATLPPPAVCIASATSSAESASMGCTGRKSSRRYDASAARAASPRAITALATAPRSPASITARRSLSLSTFAAFATASSSTPSSAPCLTSPVTSDARKCCSSCVARAKSPRSNSERRAVEPFAGRALKCGEGFVHVAQLERRVRRRRHLARLDDRGPADADLPLPRPADEESDRDRDLVAAQFARAAAASFAVLSSRRDAAATSAEVSTRLASFMSRYGLVKTF